MRYCIAVEEWLYPTESGRNVIEDYDTREEALIECEKLADNEYENFQNVCGDADYPQRFSRDENCSIIEGWIITPKNGLDEWYYQARVIEVDNGPLTENRPQ